MRLDPNELKINQIMLDPYNPRFFSNVSLNQKELQSKIMSTGDAKELLNSMQQGIKWVNRIVVRHIDTLTEIERNSIFDIDNFKYIVVEGNTRLACLKDVKMEGHFQKDSDIPCLEAVRDEGESQEAYECEIRLTQGIANVMVVKEWKPIYKARHLYRLYRNKESLNPNLNMAQIVKQIAHELGMKVSDVRTNVTRFSFFDEICKQSDALGEEQWKYLEVFDVNEKTRGIFGMIPQTINFEWNGIPEKEQSEDAIYKNELLNEIPNIINSARREEINSKEFRNIFRAIVSGYNENNIEDIKNEIMEIIDDNEEMKTWKELYQRNSTHKSDEEIWNEDIVQILSKLNSFPSAADWAVSCIENLDKIARKTNKHIKIIKAELEDD